MTPAILWGGTGQARVLREALTYSDIRILAIFDNRAIPSPFDDVPIFIGEEGLADWQAHYRGEAPVAACVAIGGDRGSDRLALMQMLETRGYPALTVVHRRAFVATNAVLGRGCQILAMASVCAGARLGDAVIVNTASSVDHDCVLGPGVHVAPGAHLAGEVQVDDCAFIGTGAVVLPGLHIGAHAAIGAGAVVTRDVPRGATVTGNPARWHPIPHRRDDA